MRLVEKVCRKHLFQVLLQLLSRLGTQTAAKHLDAFLQGDLALVVSIGVVSSELFDLLLEAPLPLLRFKSTNITWMKS